MAGFLGLFGSDAPSAPKQIDLDSGSAGLINDAVTRGNRSADEFANDSWQDADKRAMSIGGFGGGHDNTGVDDGQKSAISTAYGSVANHQINQLKQLNSMNSQIQKANQMNRAASAALQQQQVKIQSMQDLADAQSQNEFARAGFIAAISGVGATAAGLYVRDQRNKKTPTPTHPPANSANFNVQGQAAGRDSYNMMGDDY